MLRRGIIVFIGLLLVLAFFNYDKVASKVLKRLPDKVDNYLAEMFLPEKFWLHRVNSVEKQKEFYKKYAGLEFDIIFYDKENAFENSHDVENLEKYNLEAQLKVYRDLSNYNGIWLDFKNLTDKNKIESLYVLNDLLAKYKINKDKIWVESSNWQALKVFKDAGFKTSYYFPYYNFTRMSTVEINQAKTITENIALSGNVDAISFYGGYYDFINDLKLPPPVLCYCLG